jgi:hypothetical protein
VNTEHYYFSRERGFGKERNREEDGESGMGPEPGRGFGPFISLQK